MVIPRSRYLTIVFTDKPSQPFNATHKSVEYDDVCQQGVSSQGRQQEGSHLVGKKQLNDA